MARESFKTKLTKAIPVKIERNIYMTITVISLILLYWGWKPLPGVIYVVRDEPIGNALLVISILGNVITFNSSCMTNHFELFGLSQSYSALTGNELSNPVFKQPLLDKCIRHPLMLGFFIAFWATPYLTVMHIIYALGITVHILIGTYFEEKDLNTIFEADYSDYKK